MADEPQFRASDLARMQPEQSRRAPGKKDTKRWCRGKVGVEHEIETRLESAILWRDKTTPCGWSYGARNRKSWFWCAHEDKCTRCGKTLWLKPEDCPDWTEAPRGQES